MFNNYKIIEKNGEKILVLYIDNFMEFGIDNNNHHKHSNMKKEIEKIIKKIAFDGEKVALTLGGIVLATILIVENPKVSDNLDFIYVNSDILPSNSINLVVDKETSQVNTISSLDNIETDDNSNKVENIKITNNTEKKEISKIEKIKEEALIPDIKEESTKVTIYRSNGSIITLDLEEYLIGVVGAEMPAAFDIEALKAQAVISRTYALRSLEIGRRLTDNVSTQSYKDEDELRKLWDSSFDIYYSKVKEAVNSTKGVAIYYDNNYIDALFFSTSNGMTEDSKYVWGNSIPYLKSVDSSWDKDATTYLRDTDKDLANVLNILGVSDSNFSIVSRDESGRVLEVRVGNKSFTGVEFRNLIGLRSADFDIEISGNTIKFTTRGYGHGVGLSQYGANGMAKDGYNYKDIIKHYYTGVDVR